MHDYLLLVLVNFYCQPVDKFIHNFLFVYILSQFNHIHTHIYNNRVDEILMELHHDRHSHLRHTLNSQFRNICLLPSSFPKRLLAENLPLTSEGIQTEVLRRLRMDQVRMQAVAEGKKHVLETVQVNVLEKYYDEVNERVLELLALQQQQQQQRK